MSYGKPEITERTITCELCKYTFKKITYPHLNKHHKINISKYKEINGFNKTQPLEAKYITRIRIEKEKEHNGRANLDSINNQWKKGITFKNRKYRKQYYLWLDEHNKEISKLRRKSK